MKKLLHISFTLVLTVMLLLMGSGVTFRHCSCSGETTVILSHTPESQGDNSMTKKGCMTVQTVSLSPTTQMQPAVYDFHAFQPLVAIINNWQLIRLIPEDVESDKLGMPERDYGPPPRQYLHLLTVLTI